MSDDYQELKDEVFEDDYLFFEDNSFTFAMKSSRRRVRVVVPKKETIPDWWKGMIVSVLAKLNSFFEKG